MLTISFLAVWLWNLAGAIPNPASPDVGASGVQGFYTVRNASDTESFMNHNYMQDMYVFVIPLHKLNGRTIYWEYESPDDVISPGASRTYYANEGEEYLIRIGFSTDAGDFRWQRTITSETRYIESLW